MAILSTGISNVSYRNLLKKEIALILKRIVQLPQNLARVHNLVGSFDKSHKNFNFSIPIVSIVFDCSSIVRLLFQL